MATGGDIIEVTCNHPDLGALVFYPKASEESKYDIGGFRSNDDAKGIDGSGAMIDQMNRTRWSFEIPLAWDMNDPNRQEMENISKLQTSPTPGDWTFTHINGSVYNGKGKPVGDLTGNGNNATVTLKVAGGGSLKQL